MYEGRAKDLHRFSLGCLVLPAACLARGAECNPALPVYDGPGDVGRRSGGIVQDVGGRYCC